MVITNYDQVTPTWLTEKLAVKGVLQHGQVSGIEYDTQTFNRGFLSNIAILKVHYSNGASGTLPSRLFLKMSKPDLHPELLNRGCHEIEFYQAVAGLKVELPVPTYYDAEHDGTTYQSHVLMGDLSLTHFQKPLPIPPSNRHCEMIVESLAHLHAAWWNNPRLGVEIGERLNANKIAQVRRRLEDTIPSFMDYLGDALLPKQRQVYERILSSSVLSKREKRLCELKQVTLIHGDAHTGNLMLPHDVEHERVVLIDWHLWDISTATIDLAFLMALHWSPQRRASLERLLLRHYFDQLSTYGVCYQSWEELWQDYREAVIIMTLIPIGQFRRKSPSGVIWFGLQDSMAAFDDLNCSELL